MWNRWQDPETGRFISEDPAQAGENFYAYIDNNPELYIDPTGLDLTQGQVKESELNNGKFGGTGAGGHGNGGSTGNGSGSKGEGNKSLTFNPPGYKVLGRYADGTPLRVQWVGIPKNPESVSPTNPHVAAGNENPDNTTPSTTTTPTSYGSQGSNERSGGDGRAGPDEWRSYVVPASGTRDKRSGYAAEPVFKQIFSLPPLLELYGRIGAETPLRNALSPITGTLASLADSFGDFSAAYIESRAKRLLDNFLPPYPPKSFEAGKWNNDVGKVRFLTGIFLSTLAHKVSRGEIPIDVNDVARYLSQVVPVVLEIRNSQFYGEGNSQPHSVFDLEFIQ